MRFLHTSDWHIGGSKALKDDALPRQLGVLDSIADIARSRGVDVIVTAGDVFDVETPSEIEQMALLERMLAFDRAGIRLLVIRGNHDHGSMEGRTAIRYLAHMTDHGVFRGSVFTETTKYVRVHDTIFVLLCHRPRYFHEDTQAALTTLRESSLVVDCKHVVVVCHETIRGALTDTNHRLSDGAEIPLSTGETIPEYDVTYWAVGDIHIRQRIGKSAYYCGAPLQIHFGDSDPKGVLLVDTDNPDAPEFIPIDSKRLVRVRLQEGIEPHIPDNAHVKLVGTMNAIASARDTGLMTEAVARVEAVREEVVIDYQKALGLEDRVRTGIQQMLSGDDLDMGLAEINRLFATAGIGTS